MTKPNILLVVMDSVSADRLSCYGYHRSTTPEIDAFAENSTVYENAIANSSWTVPTHGTLFTGRCPSEHGAHACHKRFSVPDSYALAGRLSDNGYRTVGLSTNPWISTDFDYDTGFDDFQDVRVPLPFDTKRPRELYQRIDDEDYEGLRKYVEAGKWAFEGNPIKRTLNTIYDRRQQDNYANADVLNDRVATWLEQNGDRPFFMFLNYMDAHEPYNPPEEYLSKFRKGDCSADIAWHLRSLNEKYSSNETECINDRYDACLNYLDERIGDLIELLKKRGMADDTVVILTADHGKCLGEHDYMGVGTFLYDELVQIPLIISHPGESEPKTVSEYVCQIDIHNMILRLAGVEHTRGHQDGVISETLGPHQDVTVHDQTLPEQGLRRIENEDYNLIRDLATGEITQPTSLSEQALIALEEIEDKYEKRHKPIYDENGEEEMSADVKNQLEQLGYL
ncbi:sulfatase [Halomicroarcula sp. GCM10025817]|uniref:sulfatase n=1 Tax=Halomicroarcula sp. GCM10025817 TaxID=3252672 RepID=UPI0036089E1F